MGGCNVQCSCYTEHGRYMGMFCLYAETLECMSSAGSVWYVIPVQECSNEMCTTVTLLLRHFSSSSASQVSLRWYQLGQSQSFRVQNSFGTQGGPNPNWDS